MEQGRKNDAEREAFIRREYDDKDKNEAREGSVRKGRPPSDQAQDDNKTSKEQTPRELLEAVSEASRDLYNAYIENKERLWLTFPSMEAASRFLALLGMSDEEIQSFVEESMSAEPPKTPPGAFQGEMSTTRRQR